MFKCGKKIKKKLRGLALVLSLWLYPTNIKLERNILTVPNTLAYHNLAIIMALKSFMV